MSLYNIHDHRTSDKQTEVDIVFEVNCEDYEHLGLPKSCVRRWTGWTPNISIYSASIRAGQIRGLVTLYLYDSGKIQRDFAEITWLHPDISEKQFNPTEAIEKKLLQVY